MRTNIQLRIWAGRYRKGNAPLRRQKVMRPSEDKFMLASIALIELAQSRIGREREALREVADYLLRLSTLQSVGLTHESYATKLSRK